MGYVFLVCVISSEVCCFLLWECCGLFFWLVKFDFFDFWRMKYIVVCLLFFCVVLECCIEEYLIIFFLFVGFYWRLFVFFGVYFWSVRILFCIVVKFCVKWFILVCWLLLECLEEFFICVVKVLYFLFVFVCCCCVFFLKSVWEFYGKYNFVVICGFFVVVVLCLFWFFY